MKNLRHLLFKNILAYKVKDNFDKLDNLLEEDLKTKYVPCLPTEISKQGWCNILGENYLYQADKYIMLCLKKEEKILPKEVVEEELKNKLEELEEKEGRKLKKVEKLSLKDDVIFTLLPRAFSKYSTLNLIYDKKEKIIYINSSSTKKAEDILAILRKDLESLPVVPVAFKEDLSIEMRKILLGETKLKDLTIGDEFTLSDGEAVYNCKKADYMSEDFQEFLKEEKYVNMLSFINEESFSFNLTNEGNIKKIKIENSETEDGQLEDENAIFDANFILMAKTISEIFEKLKSQFGEFKTEDF